MTATQPESEERTISRRRVMRAAAVGIGATGTGSAALSLDGGPVGNAQAIDWSNVGVAATTVVGGPIALIAYGASVVREGDQVADALDWQSHVDEFTRAREEQLMLEQTLASLERDVQLVDNKAREEAIFRVYEQAVDSGTESDATAAAETAINEAYATVERGILQSWGIRARRAENVLKNLGSSVTTIGTTTDQPDDDSGLDPLVDQFSQTTVTDLAGNDLTYHRARQTYGVGSGPDFYPAYCFDPWPDTYESTLNGAGDQGGFYNLLKINEPDPSNYDSVDESLDVSYSTALLMNSAQWYELLVDLHNAHSSMMSEVSSMVDSYFQPAKDGEINLNEMLGPAYLTETASTAKDYQEAAMAMRAMGYPLSEQVVTFTLPTESGDPLELTGRLSWTAHQGNTLAVGQTHFAENIPGSIFAAVNLPEGVDSLSGNTTDTNTTDAGSTSTGPGADIVELTDEFTIVSAEGADGVSFKDRSLASADTSAEEVEQIFRENYAANKEATENVHETATGGGAGGFLSGSGDAQTLGIVAGCAALAALLLGNN